MLWVHTPPAVGPIDKNATEGRSDSLVVTRGTGGVLAQLTLNSNVLVHSNIRHRKSRNRLRDLDHTYTSCFKCDDQR